jgi:hypothetical protein
MARFMKKPVVIDAVQLTWANWEEICDFVPEPWFVRGVWLGADGRPLPEGETRFVDGEGGLGLLMKTLESQEFIATGGDYIIKGVKGEFYACKPDIFAATYEAV